MRPKFVFFGHIFEPIFRALQTHADFDVTLLVDADDIGVAVAEGGRLPSAPGVVVDDFSTPGDFVRPWRGKLTRALRAADVVLVSDFGPAFAQFSGRPTCFLPAGGDLTATPFPWRFRARHRRPRAAATAVVLGLWQRRGIRRATQIWTQPYPPFMDAVRELGALARLSADYHPACIDTAIFAATAEDGAAPTALSDLDDADFVVLHPARLLMDPSPALVRSGQWKNNQMLIRGFASFLGSFGGKAVLAPVDRANGGDIPGARALIERLGIGKSVRWLKAERGSGFTPVELAALYRRADVVADEFGVGWLGLIALEASATGIAVITLLDDKVIPRIYDWHPFISCKDESEIAQQLQKLATDPGMRADHGRAGTEWIKQYHAPPAIAAFYEKKLSDFASNYGDVA